MRFELCRISRVEFRKAVLINSSVGVIESEFRRFLL